MLIFVIIGCWMIVAGNSSDIWKGWLGVIFFSLCLLALLMQFTWGPLLVVNEQGIYVRSNPLLKSILLPWQEIAVITLFTKRHSTYLGFSLAPVHLEAFLQRQPLLTRKMLERRLRRFHLVARVPQRLSSYSFHTLLLSVQERYRVPIQQHHIEFQLNLEEER